MFAVADEHLALGECDRLAAEPADLLEPADAAGNVAGRGALDLILARSVGEIVGEDLVEALVDQCRIDPRFHRDVDFEHADPLERLDCGADRHGEFLFAHQDAVEPRAGQTAEDRRAEVDRGELIGV